MRNSTRVPICLLTSRNDNTDRMSSRTRSTHGRRSDQNTDTDAVTSATETSRSRGETRDTTAETVDTDPRTLRSTLPRPSTKTRRMTYSSPSTLPSHAATTDSGGSTTLDLSSSHAGTIFPQTTLPSNLPLDTETTPTDAFMPSTDAGTGRKPLSTNPLSTSKTTDIFGTTLAPDTSGLPETTKETANTLSPHSTISPGTNQRLGPTRAPRTSFAPASEFNTMKTVPQTETGVFDPSTETAQTQGETEPSRWTQWRRRMSGLVSKAGSAVCDSVVSSKRWVETEVRRAARDLKEYLDIAYEAGTQLVAVAAQTMVDHLPFTIRPRARRGRGKGTHATATPDTDDSQPTKTDR